MAERADELRARSDELRARIEHELDAGPLRDYKPHPALQEVLVDSLEVLADLLAELDARDKALVRIAENAESWHGPPRDDSGHVRALAVIASWARAASGGGSDA